MTEQNKSPQHTPGPWTLITHGDRNTYLVQAGNNHAYIGGFGNQWTGKQAHANARLIALAPELYSTLDFVRGWFIDNNLDDEYYAIFEEICATLAKMQVCA